MPNSIISPASTQSVDRLSLGTAVIRSTSPSLAGLPGFTGNGCACFAEDVE